MSLTEKLQVLANRIPSTLPHLASEEATKTSLIMPFISALGYDVFDPTEVVPEFTADVGTKKGEKVDYAIMRGEDVVILIEAKKAGDGLDTHAGQLYRYFSVTSARIGILTNGVQYRFFSDLEEKNKMDEKPFLEVDMLDLKEPAIGELTKLTKEAFDLDNMLLAANDLKYMGEIRRTFERQLENPDEEFVKFFFNAANPSGRFVQSVRDQFTRLVKKTISQAVSERVGSRLRSALEREDRESRPESPPDEPETSAQPDEDSDPGIETTEAEMEGYRIIKAIACRVAKPEQITFRDAKTYFSVLFEDNNRRPICRLHFNRAQKYVSTFDERKSETRHKIEAVDEIYQLADTILETTRVYADISTPSEPHAEP